MADSKVETAMKLALNGVVQGNLPEIFGSIGTYVTFSDKPYAIELTLDQIRGTALVSSVTGAVFRLFMERDKLKAGGSSNGRRRNRNRKRNHKQK